MHVLDVDYSKVLQQVLMLCVSYFTLATELRLGAKNRKDMLSSSEQVSEELNRQ